MSRGHLLRVLLAGAAAYAALLAAAAVYRAAGGSASLWAVVLPGIAFVLLAALLRPALPIGDAGSSPHLALSRRREAVLLALPAAALALLAFLHVDRFPHLRYDETFVLQFPANLVRHGSPYQHLADDLQPDLAMSTTGPTVLAPIALAMRLGGVGIGAARLVAGLCLGFAALALWLAARRASGPAAALIAVVGLLGMGETIETGRQAIGDFAAAGLLVLGAALWLESLPLAGRAAARRSAASGVAFGLMLLTKPSFAVCAAGFLGYLLYDRASERLAGPVHVLVPPLTAAALNLPWEAYRTAASGDSILAHAARRPYGLDYLTPALAGSLDKAKEALARPEAALALAGLVFSLSLPPPSRRQGVLFALVGGLVLAWWLSFRLILDRYLVVPSLLALLIAAPLVAAAASLLLREDDARPLARAGAVAVITVGLVLPAGRAVSSLVKVAGGRAAMPEQVVAAALRERLEPGATIHADRPPLGVLLVEDRKVRLLAADAAGSLEPGTLYLQVGSPPPPLDATRFETVCTAGGYRLLRRR